MPPRAAQCPAVYPSAPQCSPVPPRPGALAPATGLCTCANGALNKSQVLHLHLHQPRTWHVRLYKLARRTGLCTGVCTSPKRCRSLSPAPKLARAFTQAPTFAHPLAQAPPLSEPLTRPAQGRAGVGVGPAPLKPAAPSSPPLPAPTDPPSPSAPPAPAVPLHFTPLQLPLCRRLQTVAVLQWVCSCLALGE